MWVFEQLRDLRDRYGYDVAAILSGENGTLVDRFRAAGIPVHAADFDFTANADLLTLPRKVVRLIRLLRRERFDIIQTHLFHSMVIGRITAWLADVPVRFSMIAGPFHLEAYTPRWIDRFTCWMETRTIASCEFTRTLYRQMGVPERRLAVIYYGPDETKFDPTGTWPADVRAEFAWPSDTPLIGMIAYFYPVLPNNRWIPTAVHGRSVKSQEDLIRAMPLVMREFPQAKLLLVGSGWEQGGKEYRQQMHRLVGELGLTRAVLFTGFRSDVPALLRAFDVSVQPSLNENLGGTIESLLMQCPTVATRVGGMVDAVVDGETGVLANPSDPASLAEAILKVLRDPIGAKALGVAGRDRMLQGFTLRSTVDSLSDLYESSVRDDRRGYRLWVRICRLPFGFSLCLLIVMRYCFLDAWLLSLWDTGWRPWRRNALRIFPGRMLLYRFYTFVGRHRRVSASSGGSLRSKTRS